MDNASGNGHILREIKRIMIEDDHEISDRALLRVILESNLYIIEIVKENKERTDKNSKAIESNPSIIALYRKKPRTVIAAIISPFVVPLMFHFNELKSAIPSLIDLIKLLTVY